MKRSNDRLERIEPERVCIIKPSSMGDVIHAMPILSALRGRWPSAHLAWVVNRPFTDLLDGHRHLDELIVYDRGRRGLDGAGIGGMAGLLHRLSRSRFDLTIDLQGLLRSALMVAAARARIRVGMADAREGSRWFYTHRIDAPRLGLHAVDRVLRVARAFGAEVVEPHFHLPIPDEARRWAAEVVEGLPRPRIILNPGAQWSTKRWPPVHFAEIGRLAAERYGAGLMLVGAQGDRPLADALIGHLAPIPILDLCGRTRLPELAALALESDLVLSNDTGPLHLAAAAGARVLGIYTCTSPELTGPYGPRAATVRTGVWCAASFRKTCRRLDCMAELRPEQVWTAVVRQLEAAGFGSTVPQPSRRREDAALPRLQPGPPSQPVVWRREIA
jgi:lipopolysaccharide heptosyltransferase I